ncbi:hypothetical protein ACIOGZ_35450 [Kitasatospora sp. NPDC088160]|uniref:hypothetical protein n=1 Tax=Kitasatospora sp. NPDC088160 TaxID=3364072 RepID=UPI00381B73BD
MHATRSAGEPSLNGLAGPLRSLDELPEQRSADQDEGDQPGLTMARGAYAVDPEPFGAPYVVPSAPAPDAVLASTDQDRTTAQATHWSDRSCPAHQDSDGDLRASAGWLLEPAGCRPGRAVADGVRCPERRTLTVTAHGAARAAGFDQELADLAARVATATGIVLQPEPTRVGLRVTGP